MKKFCRKDYIIIQDKKSRNFSVYDIYGRGLVIKSFTIKDDGIYKGFISSFEFALYKNGEYSTYKGKTQEELVSFLKTLSITKKVYSPYKKEIMIIYTTNLHQLRGFLQKYITLDFTKYFQIFDTIEIRDISSWIDTKEDACCIAKNASELIDKVFIPEKFFYITPNQRPRKLIKKAIGNRNFAPDLMPPSADIFINHRKALYAGVMFETLRGYTYTTKGDISMIYYDLTSAYPFSMIALKHPMTPITHDTSLDYKKYDIDKYFTIGLYKITYIGGDRRLRVYGLEYANEEPITKYIQLCNRDLNTLSKLCDKIDIECLDLWYSELDYLPQEIIDEVIRVYKEKQRLKGCGVEYDLIKKVVNGISGDLSRKPTDDISIHENYKEFKNNRIFSMYWGISVLASIRAILVEASLKVNAIYGDTDGLFCYAYMENILFINSYNKNVRKMLIDLRHEDIVGIGEFKIEKSGITRFKSFGIKTYAYESGGNVICKICGMKRDLSEKIGSEAFNDDYKLKYGLQLNKVIVDKKVTYENNISDGYYVEYYRDIENPIDMLNMALDEAFTKKEELI
jgi:hypothetical protein